MVKAFLKSRLCDPPVDCTPANINSDLLKQPIPGDKVYHAALEAYKSQEEGLRSLQSRAAHLTSICLLVATGMIWTVATADTEGKVHVNPTLAVISLAFLFLALFLLLWALKPIRYSAPFSPESLTNIPKEVNNENQFLIWLAYGYEPLIRSVQSAASTVHARTTVGLGLLLVSLVFLLIACLIRPTVSFDQVPRITSGP